MSFLKELSKDLKCEGAECDKPLSSADVISDRAMKNLESVEEDIWSENSNPL
jgi:hypothetical protein